MSLINDALKKAQKQRTGEAPSLASMPSIGGEAPQRIAKRSKPAGFNALLIRLGLGAAGLAVLVIGGYFAFRAKPATGNLKPEISQTTPAAGSVKSSIVSPQLSPSAPAPVPVPVAAAFTLPVAPKTEPEPAKHEPVVTAVPPSAQVSGLSASVSQSENRGQTPAGQQAGTVKSQVTEPAAPARAPKLAGKAIDYIENLRIAGIRASATDSKVLMNDRVYRIGDIVEREMNLKLVGITSSSLTFENEEGARYTRTF